MDMVIRFFASMFIWTIYLDRCNARSICKEMFFKKNQQTRHIIHNDDFSPSERIKITSPLDTNSIGTSSFDYKSSDVNIPASRAHMRRNRMCFISRPCPERYDCCRHIPRVAPPGRSSSLGTQKLHTNRNGLHMAMDIKIRIVGKKNGGEKWIDDAYSVYTKRIGPASGLKVETVWHKNDVDLIKGVEADKAKGNSVIMLDPIGVKCSSENFSSNLYKWFEKGGSRVSFVIGGAEGLPVSLRGTPPGSPLENRKYNFFSLSDLTFTHQFARVLLVEQIYRASEIKKGSGYHK
mmetsp:Transcript_40127/g.94296  ORF Transcript_40127/g.94296 Transcript_40127/m.94296 type:complete len:292 (-) Transcript_40127:4129-5004(-)